MIDRFYEQLETTIVYWSIHWENAIGIGHGNYLSILGLYFFGFREVSVKHPDRLVLRMLRMSYELPRSTRAKDSV